MDQERFKRILSLLELERDELTLRERQFVEAVEKYFNENGKVTDQQESVLEGIYKEKVWIRKAFFGQRHLLRTLPRKLPRGLLLKSQLVRNESL